MRLNHFNTLQPVCPRCYSERGIADPLEMGNVINQVRDMIVEGSLICRNRSCNAVYPIIDGVPVIFANLGNYINENFYHLTIRNDLSDFSESLLGDAAGPGAQFNTLRHYSSIYGWDHYGDQAPDEIRKFIHAPSGGIVQCLNTGVALAPACVKAPVLDIGCAAGRSSIALAETHDVMTLGVDLNFSLLRQAQLILREQRVYFPLKRSGLVYDRLEYPVRFDRLDQVDFWACDAQSLPFTAERFGFISALNVLDTVHSPRQLLLSIRDRLVKEGYALLATPYDWSAPVPVDNWIGGHSKWREENVSSEQSLKNMMGDAQDARRLENLKVVGEVVHHPWALRIHDRHVAQYDSHIVMLQKKQKRRDERNV